MLTLNVNLFPLTFIPNDREFYFSAIFLLVDFRIEWSEQTAMWPSRREETFQKEKETHTHITKAFK